MKQVFPRFCKPTRPGLLLFFGWSFTISSFSNAMPLPMPMPVSIEMPLRGEDSSPDIFWRFMMVVADVDSSSSSEGTLASYIEVPAFSTSRLIK